MCSIESSVSIAVLYETYPRALCCRLDIWSYLSYILYIPTKGCNIPATTNSAKGVSPVRLRSTRLSWSKQSTNQIDKSTIQDGLTLLISILSYRLIWSYNNLFREIASRFWLSESFFVTFPRNLNSVYFRVQVHGLSPFNRIITVYG